MGGTLSQQYSSDGYGPDRQQHGQDQQSAPLPYGPPPQYDARQAGYQQNQNPYINDQCAHRDAPPPQSNPYYTAPQPHRNEQNPYLQQPEPAQRDRRKLAGGLAMVVFGALLLLGRISNASNGLQPHMHDNAERLGYMTASSIMLVASIYLIVRGVRLISRSKG